MNRKKVLGYVDILFPKDFVIFYIGSTICGEVQSTEREYCFYLIDDTVDYFSLVLGMSFSNENINFVIVFEDYYFLNHFNSLFQMVASKCKNITLLLLETEEYPFSGGLPTIYESIRSMKGVSFNMGFTTHDYTHYFSNKVTLKNLDKIVRTVKSPTLAYIRIDDTRLFNLNTIKDNSDELLTKIRGLYGSYTSNEQLE